MLAYLDTLIGFSVVMLAISLLITMLTQAASAAFSHRGSNLRWGLQKLFEQIDPSLTELKARAKQLAEAVLTHPVASGSLFAGYSGTNRLLNRFKLAAAIRPDELITVLSRLSAAGGLDKQLAADVNALLGAPNPAAARQATLLSAILPAAAGAPRAESPTMVTPGNLEIWFDTIMDRVSQRFTMWMRLWTIGFACVFAFGTGLDSFQLTSELYRNGDFREKLVGAGKQIADIADTLGASSAKTPDEFARNALTGVYTAAMKKALADEKVAAAPPSAVESESVGRAWIDTNVPQDQRQAVLSAFSSNIDQGAKDLIGRNAQNGVQVKSILDAAGFDVLKCRWDASRGWWQIPGIVATAALLSLGAPFWFNLLKSLANLRPTVAAGEKSA